MKSFNRILSLCLIAMIAGYMGCSDPEVPPANATSGGSSDFKANFIFANATVDAPSLDLYVNGIKIGTSTPGASTLYSKIAIPSSGQTGSATANTSIRAKATTGTIGGLLAAEDLIYRSTNNGINNFAAVTGLSYTVFAIDSLDRPVPVRKSRVMPTIVVADVTYWNPNTATQISASRRDSLNPANCQSLACPNCTGCINWDANLQAQTTSSQTEFNNLVTVGLVPLGITDRGGVRFYTVPDNLLSFTTTATTNAGLRFINTVANANGVTAAPNTNGSKAGPPIWARLRPAAGADIILGSNTTHVANATSFNPTVGSRTGAAVAFTSQAIATAGVGIAYTLQISTDAAYTVVAATSTTPANPIEMPVSFAPNNNYTVFVRGIAGKVGAKGISAGIINH